MLRTPTQIVELGPNSTIPFIKNFHTKYPKQQQNNLYHDHFYQKEYRYQTTAKTTQLHPSTSSSQRQKPPQQHEKYTKEHLTKTLLSSTPFSFKKIKKPKTTKTSDDCDTTTPQTTRMTCITFTKNYTNNNNNNNLLKPVKTPATKISQNTTKSVSSYTTLSSSPSISTSSAFESASEVSIAASVTSMSPTSQSPSRISLFDSCHRKIRLIGGGPVAFLGGLVAKARRKERDGEQNSTDTKLYLEESVLERKLPEADLKALVDLPAGLDYNEWLASHTLALFEHVNLVYGTISEFCTPSGCADMTGPGNRTYLWFDEKGKKTRVAAPQYIDYVMTFTQKTVSDESIFPTKYANEFPSSFESIARKILRLQFHVIAHLYAAHFREIALLGLHTHLNLTFAHLTALHRRFNLIDEKETDVLRDLEVALRLTDDSHVESTEGVVSTNVTTHYNTVQQQATGHLTCGSSGTADYVNLVQQTAVTGAVGALIDGDAASPPICSQPEGTIKSTASAVFGGGGGLIGGILGDLTSGEFGDTTHYCTSAVPSSGSCISTEATANSNNGAGALHLNFNNNNHHHHHHLTQAHQHHLLQQQHQQNSGLIQCNASTAPSSSTSTTTTTA